MFLPRLCVAYAIKHGIGLSFNESGYVDGIVWATNEHHAFELGLQFRQEQIWTKEES